MQVARIETVRGWVGNLLLCKVGYYWTIKTKVNGKMQTVAQSYYYTTEKQKAYNNLLNNYKIMTGYNRNLLDLNGENKQND